MTRRIIIAIDGPAGAGKSTIARAVARRLGCVYIDTGAMYRAVGLWALRSNIPLDDLHKLEQLAAAARIEFEAGTSTVLLNGEDVTTAIREATVSDAASKASAISGVRRAMVAEQRRMAENASVVMEGRDIGTVVFPNADVKIFLDADPRTRAERRTAELRQRGADIAAETVAREMAERDQRDRTRAEAPLVQAADAVYIDTTPLTIDQVEEEVLRIVRSRISNGRSFASE
jgi:cytidylate kinase